MQWEFLSLQCHSCISSTGIPTASKLPTERLQPRLSGRAGNNTVLLPCRQQGQGQVSKRKLNGKEGRRLCGKTVYPARKCLLNALKLKLVKYLLEIRHKLQFMGLKKENSLMVLHTLLVIINSTMFTAKQSSYVTRT